MIKVLLAREGFKIKESGEFDPYVFRISLIKRLFPEESKEQG
jgi:hypothetical protein